MAASPRLPQLDLIKVLCAQCVVMAHLTSYGPVLEAITPTCPELLDWMFSYVRMVVVLFFVASGYLVTSLMAPQQVLTTGSIGRAVVGRFLRLAPPSLAAVILAVVCSALVRPWLDDPIVPAAPTWPQFLAHATLLQSALGFDSLNTGVWYMAMDLQIFAAFVALMALGRNRRSPWLGPALVALTSLASLLWWNRLDRYEDFGGYFFAMFATGAFAYWIRQSPHPRRGSLILAALALGVMALDAALGWVPYPRWRLPVALLGALWLIHAPAVTAWPARWQGFLSRWGERSYSQFLTHFSLYLLTSAAFVQLGLSSPAAGFATMALTWALSLPLATAFHRWVEGPLGCHLRLPRG